MRDLTVAGLFFLAAPATIWAALTQGLPWLVGGAVAMLLFAVGLTGTQLKRPLILLLGTESIAVKTLIGKQAFRSDRLDEIQSKQGTHDPCLILRFSDGQQLVIYERQITKSINDLKDLFERQTTTLQANYPWSRFQDKRISPAAFGPGSTLPFSAYLERLSSVQVSSVEDAERWLQSCTFVTDQELFGEDDYWQHPVDFEQTQKGDCEDHALWTWRKLAHLGMDVEFVGGTMNGEPHAWVTFRLNDTIFLFETTEKRGTMVFPASQVRQKYTPRIGVNRHLVTYRYPEEKSD